MEMKPFKFGKKVATFAAFLMAICLFAMPVAADRQGNARNFIENLADRAIHSLTPAGISHEERIRQFRTMFDENFAAETIGKWVLGRYWRQLTSAEQAEYLKLFEDYIIAAYVDRFASYTGEKLHVTKVLAEEGDRVSVFSEIQTPDGGKTPIHVDWRIEGTDLQFKIIDLVVEGVSMSTTLRADFGSIIRRDGGNISGLLAVLREKTATRNTAD